MSFEVDIFDSVSEFESDSETNKNQTLPNSLFPKSSLSEYSRVIKNSLFRAERSYQPNEKLVHAFDFNWSILRVERTQQMYSQFLLDVVTAHSSV